jgi:hypothetical protein
LILFYCRKCEFIADASHRSHVCKSCCSALGSPAIAAAASERPAPKPLPNAETKLPKYHAHTQLKIIDEKLMHFSLREKIAGHNLKSTPRALPCLRQP